MCKRNSYDKRNRGIKKYWKGVQKFGFAFGISGIIICIALIALTLKFEHGIQNIFILFVSIIIVIIVSMPLSLIPKAKNIAPVTIKKDGIEIPKINIRRRLLGEKMFISFSNITQIKKGNVFRDHICFTNDGEKIAFRISPSNESLNIEDIIFSWQRKMTNK